MLNGFKTYIGAAVAGIPALIILIQTLSVGGDITTKWGAISAFIGAIIAAYGRAVTQANTPTA